MATPILPPELPADQVHPPKVPSPAHSKGGTCRTFVDSQPRLGADLLPLAGSGISKAESVGVPVARSVRHVGHRPPDSTTLAMPPDLPDEGSFDIFVDPDCSISMPPSGPFKGGCCRTLADSHAQVGANSLPFVAPWLSQVEPVHTCRVLADITNFSIHEMLPFSPDLEACSSSTVEHVGFRSPAIVAPQELRGYGHSVASLRPALVSNGSDAPEAFSFSGWFCPRPLLCPRKTSSARPKARFQRGRAAVSSGPSPVPGVPDASVTGRRQSSYLQVASAAALAPASSHFTSFDSVRQSQQLLRQPHWGPYQCLFHAISTSHLPNPVGGLISDSIEGFPEPQVLVSREAMRLTHRAVVLVFDIHPRLVWACDVPISQTLLSFLVSTPWPSTHPAQSLLHPASLVCTCAVAEIACEDVVPDEVQVIRVTAGRAGQGPPASLPTIADRPPTPPLPSRRWERSSALTTPMLDQHHSHQAAPSSGYVVSVSAIDSRTEFAVFDVYHHARLLPCPSSASDLHLLQLAMAATPELGGAVHFRMLTHLLPGLPRRQLVMWGDLMPGSVVFPVSFGSGVNSVCTIEVPERFSAVQACTFLCRHCQLPEVIIERLADLDLRFVVSGNAVYPLDPMACAQADSAVLLGDLFSAISLNSHRLSFVRGTQTPSSSSTPSVVSHPVDDDHSHFVVFLESRPAQLLPVTVGSTVTDLVIAAIEQFPELGPYTGHRVLARPVPGLPPIQVCLWRVLGVGERVLLVSTANSASPFLRDPHQHFPHADADCLLCWGNHRSWRFTWLRGSSKALPRLR